MSSNDAHLTKWQAVAIAATSEALALLAIQNPTQFVSRVTLTEMRSTVDPTPLEQLTGRKHREDEIICTVVYHIPQLTKPHVVTCYTELHRTWDAQGNTSYHSIFITLQRAGLSVQLRKIDMQRPIQLYAARLQATPKFG